MILTWMAYSTGIGMLATVAALVLERAGRALRIQVRFIWVVAMATSLFWPIAANYRAAHRPLVAGAPLTGVGQALLATDAGIAPHISWTERLTALAMGQQLDPWMIALWVALSCGVVVRLARGIRVIQHGRRIWKTRTIDGMPVLLSNDLGPAVIGFRDLRIVLPQWTLALDAPLRAVILRHEDEHRRARDPHLLLGSIIATALTPWNAALWWQCKRLRLAIETDCDARVLEREQDVERYGSLLVTIAERRGTAPPAIAAALTESISNLERRITIMTSPLPRFPRLTAAALTALATGALVVATLAPVPAAFAFVPQAAAPAKPPAVAKAAVPPPPKRVYTAKEVDVKAMPSSNQLPTYPASLLATRTKGLVTAQFVVGANGRVDLTTFKTITSSNTLFTAAVKAHLASLRFDAAQKSGVRVAQVVQMPFEFQVAPAAPSPRLAADAAASDQASAADAPQPIDADQPLFDFQVEQQVRPAPGNRAPDYPAMLRQANIQGTVTIQFVVDTMGRADMTTFKEVKSDHPLFTTAVQQHLPEMTFVPARVGGRAVKQLIKMPFVFTLAK